VCSLVGHYRHELVKMDENGNIQAQAAGYGSRMSVLKMTGE